MRSKSGPEMKARFFNRLKPFLSPHEIRDVELAYMLAKHAHRWQKRKEAGPDGQPLRYFEHLRGAALILIDEVGIVERDLIVACLMHDALEDTRDLTPELLEHLFGSNVAGIVRRLTKRPKNGYVARLRRADWRTLLVKGCDRLHNLRSLDLPEIGEEFRSRQLKETRDKYFPIFYRLCELAPVEHSPAVGGLCHEIRETVLRLERATPRRA